MIDAIIFAIKPIGKHIPHHLVLQKLKNNPACKIDMDFDKHKEAVLLSSQMPTQNYKNNDRYKYLEPQTCTSLKKKKLYYVHDEK